MTKEAAEILETYSDGDIRTDYSGRGMYGERTAGIVFQSEKQFYKAIAEVMQSEDEGERTIVSQALRSIRADSMGMDIIFY